MQKLKFIRRSHGTSKKGNAYDMTEVSDGLSAFTLSNGNGVGQRLANMDLEVGDDFEAEVHVSTAYGSLRGTIEDIEDGAE